MRPREFQLTQAEIEAFERAERETREAVELRRMQGVRMYGSGMSMDLIGCVTNAPRRTLARWVEEYRERGLEGLKAGWQGGNNRVLTEAEREQVIANLGQSPTPAQAAGKVNFWGVEQVRELVKQVSGKGYRSRESYRQLLLQAGLSFQQPEGIYRSRPSEALISDFEADAEKKSPTSSKTTRMG